MKPLKPFAMLFIALAGSAWASDAGRHPVRQIDRPLIPPKHMWQEVLTQNSVIHLDGESPRVDEDLAAGFLPGLPSWSITDNLQWVFVPAPLLRYLVTRNNINSENGPAVKGFSLTVEGGISGIAYSRRDGTVVQYQFGTSAKNPISDRLWLEGTVQGYFRNGSLLSIGTSGGLGVQFTDRVHATADYAFANMFEDGYRIYNGGTLGLGFNFTQNLSLDLKSTLLVGSRTTTLNPGANLAFYW